MTGARKSLGMTMSDNDDSGRTGGSIIGTMISLFILAWLEK
jgi:hypothetical protein